jgi:hypothetical protein
MVTIGLIMDFRIDPEVSEGSQRRDDVVRIVHFGLSNDKNYYDYIYISGIFAVLDKVLLYGALERR